MAATWFIERLLSPCDSLFRWSKFDSYGIMAKRMIIILALNLLLFTLSIFVYFGNQKNAPINVATLNDIITQNEASENDMLSEYAERSHILPLTSTTTPTSQTTSDYTKLRRFYKVPPLKNVWQVDCKKLFENDTEEFENAYTIMKKEPKVPIYEETYDAWTKDCPNFIKKRGYITIPLSKEEEQFPIAFSIAMYKDVEQTERLLRAIYQPQNLYCIHIDTKTSLLIHRTIAAIADCLPNVFVASHLDKIKWGDVSVLLPALNCMRELVRRYRGKWKYYINLTGQEFPLRTNLELVKIAKIFNGSNDIAGSQKRMDFERVNYHWTHRWSKTYQQTIFYNTFKPKEPAPFNLTFYKGELHGLFSRRMVEYIVESSTAKEYLQWCWDTGHPSEHYWNVLNYNVHLKAPGGYQGPSKAAEKYAPTPIIRAKHWVSSNYNSKICYGFVVRGICVLGLRDLVWLSDRRELFANKFYLTQEYFTLDCLEERHRLRTMSKKSLIDETFYKNLPTVKYSRKDGL